MKKLLPLLLLILIGCSKEPINMNEMLVERNYVYYTRDTNQPYSGPVFKLYENGQFEWEGTLKNGIENGPFKTYHKYYPNGLSIEGTYKDGELHGPYKTYYENGQIYEEATFKNGNRDGLYKMFNRNGKLIISKEY